eukprot:2231712-Pleurochrysis_carterae.AAC.1
MHQKCMFTRVRAQELTRELEGCKAALRRCSCGAARGMDGENERDGGGPLRELSQNALQAARHPRESLRTFSCNNHLNKTSTLTLCSLTSTF